MKIFCVTLAVCLLVAVERATGCSSSSECPGLFDSSSNIYCCSSSSTCCSFSEYFSSSCSSNSQCPGTFDSSDKEYCCSSDRQCCTLNEYFGYDCSSDADCSSSYTCTVNTCVYTGGLTTSTIIGIACGAVAFLIFVVLLPIIICCCCCAAGSGGSSKSRVTTTTVMNPGVMMQPVPQPQTYQVAQPPQNIYSTTADYSYSNSAFQGPPMPQPAPYIPPVR